MKSTLKDSVITDRFEFLIFKNATGWYADVMIRKDASVVKKWAIGKTKKAIMRAIDGMR